MGLLMFIRVIRKHLSYSFIKVVRNDLDFITKVISILIIKAIRKDLDFITKVIDRKDLDFIVEVIRKHLVRVE